MPHAHAHAHAAAQAHSRCRPLALAAAAFCAALLHASASALEVQVLLMQRGSIFAFAPYNVLDDPVLNGRGQVALLASYQTGLNSYSTSNLLQWSEAAGPSGPAVLAGMGPQFARLSGGLSQNEVGQVAFQALSQTTARRGIYLSSNLGDGPISEVGGTTAYLNEPITFLGVPQMSGTRGDVAFGVSVSASVGRSSLWLVGGANLGDSLARGSPKLRRLDDVYQNLGNTTVPEPYAVASVSKLVLSDNSLGTAFAGQLGHTVTGVTFDNLRGAVMFQDPVREHVFAAAYNGQATGSAWTFQNLQFAAPALAAGRGRYDGAGLAFVSQLSKNADGSGATASGVYRFKSKADLGAEVLPFLSPAGTLTEVARTGTAAPGGGNYLSFDSKVLINGRLQVAYAGFVSADPLARPTSPKAQAHGSIFIDRSDIADEGQRAPTRDGGLSRSFSQLELKALNSAGAVLFSARLVDPADSSFANGLFLGDGRDLLAVARTGDVLAGAGLRTVASVSASDNAMNRYGQVAYGVTFNDNAVGTYLYTPTLHWRNPGGPRGLNQGAWDDAAGWTLGLAPAEMHDVKIDPAFRVSLVGPTSDRSVRSLEVGTGAGAVRLALQPGVQLTVLNGGLQVGAQGVLSGSGTVMGNVVNRGLIQATNIVVFDTITNHGRIQVGAPVGHLQGALNNAATGTLSVAAGEQLTLFGFGGVPSTSTAHENLGSISVVGGALTVVGGLSNRATLHATDARLNFVSRGLINRASVVLDGVQTDVAGEVFNAGTGHIATGAATRVVFHGPVINAGEIAVGAADPVHFLAGLSLTSSSRLSFVLGAATPLSEALLTATGAVGLAGLLTASFATGVVPQAGDSYTLFDFSGATLLRSFSALALPDLGPAGAWDTRDLLTTGRLTITAVPEPRQAALLLAGLCVMLRVTVIRRRRMAV